MLECLLAGLLACLLACLLPTVLACFACLISQGQLPYRNQDQTLHSPVPTRFRLPAAVAVPALLYPPASINTTVPAQFHRSYDPSVKKTTK